MVRRRIWSEDGHHCYGVEEDMEVPDDYVHVDDVKTVALDNGWIEVEDLLKNAEDVVNYLKNLKAKYLQEIIIEMKKVDWDKLIKEKTENEAVDGL